MRLDILKFSSKSAPTYLSPRPSATRVMRLSVALAFGKSVSTEHALES